MKSLCLFLIAVTLIFVGFSANAADTYAFVTQTTNASTISFLNPGTGAQTGARVLGFTANSGATYSPNGKLAFFIVGASKNAITGYNLQTAKIAGTAAFPNQVFSLTVNPVSGVIYVSSSNAQSKPVIYQLNPATFSFRAVYSGGVTPLAVSPDGGTLYGADYSSLISLNTSTFQQTASVPIPNISRIVVSPDGSRLYLSFSSFNMMPTMVTEYNPSSQTVIGSVTADANAYVAVSPDGSAFYTTLNSNPGETLLQVSSTSVTVANSVSLGEAYYGGDALAIRPDGSSLAVEVQLANGVNLGDPQITLVALPSLTIQSATPVGNGCGVGYPTNAVLAVTNCAADLSDVVDVTTRKRVAQFDAGPGPLDTLTGLNGSVLYVSNHYGVWALQANSGKVLSKIVFPGLVRLYPTDRQLALSADGSTVFVDADTYGVLAVATADNQIIGPVAGFPQGFDAPSAIATSANGKYLFVVNMFQGELLVLDQATGKLITTIPIGDVTDPISLACNKDGSVVYLSSLSPALYQIDVSSQTVTQIPSQSFGSLALSPDEKTLYVSGTFIEAINTATLTSTELISPVPPGNLAITPDGLELVITSGGTAMGVLNLANPSLSGTIPVGGATGAISLR